MKRTSRETLIDLMREIALADDCPNLQADLVVMLEKHAHKDPRLAAIQKLAIERSTERLNSAGEAKEGA